MGLRAIAKRTYIASQRISFLNKRVAKQGGLLDRGLNKILGFESTLDRHLFLLSARTPNTKHLWLPAITEDIQGNAPVPTPAEVEAADRQSEARAKGLPQLPRWNTGVNPGVTKIRNLNGSAWLPGITEDIQGNAPVPTPAEVEAADRQSEARAKGLPQLPRWNAGSFRITERTPAKSFLRRMLGI